MMAPPLLLKWVAPALLLLNIWLPLAAWADPPPVLHAIIVLDSPDSLTSRDDTAQALQAWLASASEAAQMQLSWHYFSQQRSSSQPLIEHIRDLKPGFNDAILFFFSGHAAEEACGREEELVFQMAGGGYCFAQNRVHAALINKDPRLLVTVFDAYQPVAFAQQPGTRPQPLTSNKVSSSPLGGLGEWISHWLSPQETSADLVSPRVQQAAWGRLFKDYRGWVNVQSHDPCLDGPAYPDQRLGVGLYTQTFLTAVQSFPAGNPANWTGLLEQANRLTYQRSQPYGPAQSPRFELNLTALPERWVPKH